MIEISLERALAGGDLSRLDEAQRTELVVALCKHTGLDINTSPFGFYRDEITGIIKVVIRKPGIEQLRHLHNVSVTNMVIQFVSDVIVFTAHGETNLRKEVSSGTMSLDGLVGPERAKAFLLAETKAKHRLTLALVGLGIQEEPDVVAALATKYAAEPKPAPEPQVNHAPAIEHKDERYHISFPPPPGPSTEEVLAAGKTMQSIIDRGHSFPEPQPEKMAAEMDKSDPTPQAEAVAKPLPKPEPVQECGFESMFGGEPMVMPVEEPRDDRPMSANADIPENSRTLTSDVKEIHGQDFVQPPVEEFTPAPVPDGDPKPTPVEFKAFTARCTKLVRDVLPKAGKEASGLLLPFLKKTFGTPDIQNATVKMWEATLSKIETAGSPQAAAAILKAR